MSDANASRAGDPGSNGGSEKTAAPWMGLGGVDWQGMNSATWERMGPTNRRVAVMAVIADPRTLPEDAERFRDSQRLIDRIRAIP
jgi:hypothetical protein